MDERELRKILEGAGDAGFVVDAEGRIVHWSQSAEQLLGFSKDDVLGRHCFEILAGESDYGCQVCGENCGILKHAGEHDPVACFDLHARTASGDRKWVSVSILKLKIRQRQSLLVLHLLRDVHRQKKIQSATKKILVQIAELSGKDIEELLATPDCHPAAVELTGRETEILRLLARGRGTADIAGQLYISPTTVRNHIQHILEKLNCHTRLEAILCASRQHLI
jgi:PAS domain S-box-containing protein